MAAEALERQREAQRRREKALVALAADGVDLSPKKPKAAPKRGARAKPGPTARRSAGTLVAEGDSWFDYPFNDVLNALEDHHGFDVESVARRGDTLESMAYGSDGGRDGSAQLEAFTRRIAKAAERGDRVVGVLISGGGNDIAGAEFATLLNHARSARRGLNPQMVEAVIDQRLAEAYLVLLGAVTTVCRQLLGQPVPILLHGYGNAVPDGRGFAGGAWFLPGPWLAPGLTQKGYRPIEDGRPILVELIERFNRMLQRVAATPTLAHVRYVDVRDLLPSAPGEYRRWWANELHPTSRGYDAVAARFAAVLRESD
jgi:lysophospholipase L1-like esterase